MKRSALRSSSFLWIALASFVLAASAASCSTPEQSILITARTVVVPGATRIETIVVHVIPTASIASPATPRMETVSRTFAEINGDLPIHVAIHLQGPTPVMIHLVAVTNMGERLYATRCYAPNGVVTDEVLLVLGDPTADVDGDGFPGAGQLGATCRDPGTGATGVACDQGLCPATAGADCDDSAEVEPGDCDRDHGDEGRCIYPGADTFCGDTVDQDCRNNGGLDDDEPCIDSDGDGYSACAPSTRPDGGVVVDAGTAGDGSAADAGAPVDRGCDCADMDPMRHPGADEICGNTLDDDCSYEPGGMGAFCDTDDDGFTSNVDCDDMNPNIHPGGLVLEQCCAAPPCAADCECDGVDNNCNVLVDEHSSCASPDLDGDGHDTCTGATPNCAVCDCNDCDSGVHPGAVDRCANGIDEDGIAGDATCEATDVDGDGVFGGQDCGEGDPRTFFDAPEDCRTTASESCGVGDCSIDADMDGYSPNGLGVVDCDDTNPDVHPWATEICNGINDDCDADGDEVLDATGASGCVPDLSCGPEPRCLITFVSTHHCGACRNECNPGATMVADACVVIPDGDLTNDCSCSTNTAGGGAACNGGANETCCPLGGTFPGCFDLDDSMLNCGGCGVLCDVAVSSLCTGGTCSCGAGAQCGAGDTCCRVTSDADASCHDLQSDPMNCGACGFVCGGNSTCSAGRCVCTDADHGDCDRDLGRTPNTGCEVDLRTDMENCGGCGDSCTDQNVAGGSCSARACVIASCDPLYDDCNGNAADGCETDLTLIETCGACGTSCNPANADARCNVSGTTASCGYGVCSVPFGDCDPSVVNGCETSLRTITTCGSCANACGDDPNITSSSCPTGSCSYTCAGGFGDCGGTNDGCETSLMTSATRCGTCTNNCTDDANITSGSCSSGSCSYSCGLGFGDCGGANDGCETNLRTTAARCGSCGNNCMDDPNISSAACSTGACTYSCAAGFGDCGGVDDGCESSVASALRCGSCGNNCTDDANITASSCAAGSCGYTCAMGFADCGGVNDGCESSLTTTTRCGSCGNNCTDDANISTSACSGGVCAYGCAPGYGDCGGTNDGCESGLAAAARCGSCTNNCNDDANVATAGCSAGACTYVCDPGFGDCTGTNDGCETAVNTSMRCGSCGNNCLDQHVTAGMCTTGACVITTCETGWANCDNDTSNGCERATAGTPADCCGVTCTAGSMMCDTAPSGRFVCRGA